MDKQEDTQGDFSLSGGGVIPTGNFNEGGAHEVEEKVAFYPESARQFTRGSEYMALSERDRYSVEIMDRARSLLADNSSDDGDMRAYARLIADDVAGRVGLNYSATAGGREWNGFDSDFASGRDYLQALVDVVSTKGQSLQTEEYKAYQQFIAQRRQANPERYTEGAIMVHGDPSMYDDTLFLVQNGKLDKKYLDFADARIASGGDATDSGGMSYDEYKEAFDKARAEYMGETMRKSAMLIWMNSAGALPESANAIIEKAFREGGDNLDASPAWYKLSGGWLGGEDLKEFMGLPKEVQHVVSGLVSMSRGKPLESQFFSDMWSSLGEMTGSVVSGAADMLRSMTMPLAIYARTDNSFEDSIRISEDMLRAEADFFNSTRSIPYEDYNWLQEGVIGAVSMAPIVASLYVGAKIGPAGIASSRANLAMMYAADTRDIALQGGASLLDANLFGIASGVIQAAIESEQVGTIMGKGIASNMIRKSSRKAVGAFMDVLKGNKAVVSALSSGGGLAAFLGADAALETIEEGLQRGTEVLFSDLAIGRGVSVDRIVAGISEEMRESFSTMIITSGVGNTRTIASEVSRASSMDRYLGGIKAIGQMMEDGALSESVKYPIVRRSSNGEYTLNDEGLVNLRQAWREKRSNSERLEFLQSKETGLTMEQARVIDRMFIAQERIANRFRADAIRLALDMSFTGGRSITVDERTIGTVLNAMGIEGATLSTTESGGIVVTFNKVGVDGATEGSIADRMARSVSIVIESGGPKSSVADRYDSATAASVFESVSSEGKYTLDGVEYDFEQFESKWFYSTSFRKKVVSSESLFERGSSSVSLGDNVKVKLQDGTEVDVPVQAVIRLTTEGDTGGVATGRTVSHELVHALYSIFDRSGLLDPELVDELRKAYGDPRFDGEAFNEERAAEDMEQFLVDSRRFELADIASGIAVRRMDNNSIVSRIQRGFSALVDAYLGIEQGQENWSDTTDGIIAKFMGSDLDKMAEALYESNSAEVARRKKEEADLPDWVTQSTADFIAEYRAQAEKEMLEESAVLASESELDAKAYGEADQNVVNDTLVANEAVIDASNRFVEAVGSRKGGRGKRSSDERVQRAHEEWRNAVDNLLAKRMAAAMLRGDDLVLRDIDKERVRLKYGRQIAEATKSHRERLAEIEGRNFIKDAEENTVVLGHTSVESKSAYIKRRMKQYGEALAKATAEADGLYLQDFARLPPYLVSMIYGGSNSPDIAAQEIDYRITGGARDIDVAKFWELLEKDVATVTNLKQQAIEEEYANFMSEVKSILAERDAELAKIDERFSKPDGARYSIGPLYTGSRVPYDKPSMDYIGTGEGAHVYGWGLYASGNFCVAKSYADRYINDNENRSFYVNGKKYVDMVESGDYGVIWEDGLFDEYIDQLGGPDSDSVKKIDDSFLYMLSNGPQTVEMSIVSEAKHWAEAMREEYGDGIEADYADALAESVSESEQSESAIMIQTWWKNRPEGDESRLLSWYDPVPREQLRRIVDRSEELLGKKGYEGKLILTDQNQLLLSKGTRPDGKPVTFPVTAENPTGEQLYSDLSKNIGGTPKGTSELLYASGIDGIKYPAASVKNPANRDGRKGWNYVAFSDENLAVDSKLLYSEEAGDYVESPRYSISKARKAKSIIDGVAMMEGRAAAESLSDAVLARTAAIDIARNGKVSRERLAKIAIGLGRGNKSAVDRAIKLAQKNVKDLGRGAFAKGVKYDVNKRLLDGIRAGQNRYDKGRREAYTEGYVEGARQAAEANAAAQQSRTDALNYFGDNVNHMERSIGISISRSLLEVKDKLSTMSESEIERIAMIRREAGEKRGKTMDEQQAGERMTTEEAERLYDQFDFTEEQLAKFREIREAIFKESQEALKTYRDKHKSKKKRGGKPPERKRTEDMTYEELLARALPKILARYTFSFGDVDNLIWFIQQYCADKYIKSTGRNIWKLQNDPIFIADMKSLLWSTIEKAAKDLCSRSVAAAIIGKMKSMMAANRITTVRACARAALNRIHADKIRSSRNALRKSLIRAINKAIGKGAVSRRNMDADRKVSGDYAIYLEKCRAVLSAGDGKILEMKSEAEKTAGPSDDWKQDLDSDEVRQAVADARMTLAAIGTYGNHRHMMPGELQGLLEDLVNEIDGAKNSHKEAVDRLEAMYEADRGALVAAISENGPAFEPEEKGVSGWFEGLANDLQAMLPIALRRLTGRSKGATRKMAKAACDRVTRAFAEGSEIEHSLLNKWQNDIYRGIKAIYGKPAKARIALNKKIGPELSAKISKQGKDLTVGQVLFIYSYLLQGKDYATNIALHERDGAEYFNAVLSALDSKEIQLLAFMKSFLRRMFPEVQRVYRDLTGVTLHTYDDYFMVRMLNDPLPPVADIRAWSPIMQALHPRVKNQKDIDESYDAMNLFFATLQDYAHMIGYGARGTYVMRTLGSTEVAKAIRRYHGKKELARIRQTILDTLVPATRNGESIEKAYLCGLRWGSSLAMLHNVSGMLNIVAGMPSLALEMGSSNLLKYTIRGLADAATGRFDWQAYRELKASAGYISRVGFGFSSEMESQLANIGGFGALKRFMDKGFLVNRYLDFYSVTLPAIGYYKAMIATHMENGAASIEEAKRLAATDTFTMIELTTQSARPENQLSIVRRNRIARILIQFAQSPIQQAQYEIRAIQGVIRKEDGAWGELMNAVFINHIVVPTFMTVVKAMLDAIWKERDEDEDGEEFGYFEQLVQNFVETVGGNVILGQFSMIPMFGAVLEATLNYVAGIKRPFLRSGVAGEEFFVNMIRSSSKISKGFGETLDAGIRALGDDVLKIEPSDSEIENGLKTMTSGFFTLGASYSPFRYVLDYLKNRKDIDLRNLEEQ